MKIHVVSTLLFTYCGVLAQTPVYQPTDVDSVAEPRGGLAFFNTFVQATLRKPIQAQALGTGGRVIVGGVVEPNGTITDVKVLVGNQPDLDREAARTFALFNAWKPAKKNGQPVRQQITLPITFQPNTPFRYVNGTRITYYDKDGKEAADSTKAKFKQVNPIDNNGIPTGNIVVLELKNKDWKPYFQMPLIRQENPSNKSLKTYRIGNKNLENDWEGTFYEVNDDGKILEETLLKRFKKTFYENGAIAEKMDERETERIVMNWYENGQIRQVKNIPVFNPATPIQPEKVVGLWDKQGNTYLVNGNGQAVEETNVPSRANTDKETILIEKGTYENGFKQGVWTGRYVDESYMYEEKYDRGICIGGKAIKTGADTIRYNDIGTPPEFLGGMSKLGQFLAQNLHYPADAQRANVKGRVVTTFVVDANGEIKNVQIEKGLGYGCDEESVRVIKEMSGKWKPGLQRGEKVSVKYTMPLNFNLQ